MTSPLEHFVSRLRSAHVERDPFPHYVLDPVFPDDYYRELLRHLPSRYVYDNLYEVTDLKLDHFRHRDQRDMDHGWTARLPPELRPFWDSFNEWFLSEELAQAAMDSFGESLPLRPRPAVSIESQFIRHRAGYFLGPHSDLYTKQSRYPFTTFKLCPYRENMTQYCRHSQSQLKVL